MLRVGGQAGVMHPRHGGLPDQPFGQGLGGAGMGEHAQFQGLQALEKDPGIEGAHARPGGADDAKDLLPDALGITNHGPAQAAPLAIQVLGGGMDDQVRPQGQGPLQGRGAEAVVHRQETAMVMGQVRQGADVGHFRQGIGGGLQEQQPGVRAHGGRPGIQACQVHVTGLDAKAGQILVEQDRGAAKDGPRRDDVIPGLQQPQTGGKDGRHARGRGHAAFPAFQGRQTLLEGLDRGVGEAGIDVAGLVPAEARRRLGGAGEDEAGGGEDGLAMLALGGTVMAGADGQGGEARDFSSVHGGGSFLLWPGRIGGRRVIPEGFRPSWD